MDKICKNCRHWTRQQFVLWDNKIDSFGRCEKQSAAESDVLAWEDSNCDLENGFEEIKRDEDD